MSFALTQDLLARLESRIKARLNESSERPLVAFDADGTLWKDDVGSLTFDHALSHSALRAEALPSLREVLRQLELPSPDLSDANQLARHMERLYRVGRISEKAMAELQVWVYAGHTSDAANALAEQALSASDRAHLHHPNIAQLLERARQLGAEVWIVSASPRWIVERAALVLEVPSDNVIGGLARIEDGTLRAELASPLPYGPEKLTALRRMRPRAPLVAAFGDSSFDLELLAAADLPVGVGNKPGLLSGLSGLPHSIRLVDP